MKYQFIEQHQQGFPVVTMCRVLGVSESGYYAWRKRPTCQRKREDALIVAQIRQIFLSHREVYGSPRVHAELKEQGVHCARKRIARLMREHGITPKRKRRRVVTTNSQHENPVAPHLLQRDFTHQNPTQSGSRTLPICRLPRGGCTLPLCSICIHAW